MTNPRQKYRESKQTLRRASETGSVAKADTDRILQLTAAFDEEDMTESLPNNGEYANDTKGKKPNTLRYWTQSLKRIAERLDVPLTEADADSINQLMTDMRSGTHPDVKDSGLANNSIRNYQGCVRRFYRYHTDLDVDPNDIALISGDDTHVDDRDMLTKEEIDTIREAATHPRDLAIFDLLIYTGQRNTAIRSLRIRDIDLEEGVYYLNTNADGLKGADENGTKRPLLGAVGSLREWLRYHPDSDNPDAYLITGKPRYTATDTETMVSRNTLQYAMKQLKKKAEIDKPMYPHSIRHNFVTIAKREYRMDDATVKHLIGHSPDSNVMETTYSHLSDEDHIRAAEEAAGIRDPEQESSLTPDVCHCGEPLPAGAKACPRCGTAYTPDAKSTQKQVQQDMKETYKQTDPEDTDTQEKVDALDGLLEDPDVKAALLEKLSEE